MSDGKPFNLHAELRCSGIEFALRKVIEASCATPKQKPELIARSALSKIDRELASETAKPGQHDSYLEGMQDIARALGAIAQTDERAR